MKRLLFILPGVEPPREDSTRDRLRYLSELAEGEVLLPVWWSTLEDLPPYLKRTFPVYRVGNFCYHLLLAHRFPVVLRRFVKFIFYIRTGLQLHRKKKFDVIVIYGTNVPGLAGVVLKWLTGAKLIAELPNVPENSYRFDKPNPGWWDTVKGWLADLLLNFVGTAADCLELNYPWQVERFPRLKLKKAAVLHSFVPVRSMPAEHCDNKFILLVGFPWHTKGVDILIRAFVSIAPNFPDYTLKLMGYYPDRKHLEKLAEGCQQVEFLVPRPNNLGLQVISSCSIYVLASRTDASPRVVLEAMAARKPIIASRVGGVPYLIADNDNGLLFEPGNVNDLADKLSLLLRNPELRERLGTRAYERVMTEFDEDEYVRLFEVMLQKLDSEEQALCAGRARPQSREV